MKRVPTLARVTATATALRQRGVALVTVLVIVAAVTTVISDMLWRQSLLLRKVENHNVASQARWLARGAFDWARVVLLEDARISSVDHGGEIWATPLEPTRVNQDGVADGRSDAADLVNVSGRISDAQARYNLTNLVVEAGAPGAAAGAPRTINPRELAVLQRLFVLSGVDESAALGHAVAIAARMLRQPLPGHVDDLLDDPSLAAIQRLREQVVILPQRTPVNLNTASAEVLAARLDNLPIDRARTLVASRQQAHFERPADILRRMSDLRISMGSGETSTSTQFFLISGEVRQRRVELVLEALVERAGNGATRILDLRER